jgi:hypothetical protein
MIEEESNNFHFEISQLISEIEVKELKINHILSVLKPILKDKEMLLLLTDEIKGEFLESRAVLSNGNGIVESKGFSTSYNSSEARENALIGLFLLNI